MPARDKKEKFIKMAIHLFSKYGYDNVTLREIAFESNIDVEFAKSVFPQKETLFTEILNYIPTVVEHYNPTKKDILALLKTETPAEILSRFVSYYDIQQDLLWSDIYRFIFMEQYRNDDIGRMTYTYIIGPPRKNAAKAADIMIEQGVLLPCDSEIIGEIWGRTSFIFLMLKSHGKDNFDREEYLEMTQFFISLMVNGAKAIDLKLFKIKTVGIPFEDNINTDKTDRKQQILLASLELFSEKGFNNVTMQEIADTLKMPLVSLYCQYPSKDKIMKDLEILLYTSYKQCEQNPSLFLIHNNEPSKEFTLTLSDTYSAKPTLISRQFYRLIFREQFFNLDFQEFVIGSIFMDIDKITALLDSLTREEYIPDCDSKKIATAFVHSMCSLVIDSTVQGDINRHQRNKIRLSITALLFNLVLNGFNN